MELVAARRHGGLNSTEPQWTVQAAQSRDRLGRLWFPAFSGNELELAI
jgi:hypothetical protein